MGIDETRRDHQPGAIDLLRVGRRPAWTHFGNPLPREQNVAARLRCAGAVNQGAVSQKCQPYRHNLILHQKRSQN
jgi:hypothetical protein